MRPKIIIKWAAIGILVIILVSGLWGVISAFLGIHTALGVFIGAVLGGLIAIALAPKIIE